MAIGSGLTSTGLGRTRLTGAWGEGAAAGNENYYSTRVFRDPLPVTRKNHRSASRYEVGWYRRSVIIPQNEEWAGKRVILHIGAADFFTDAWCNGVRLGHHEGGYTPFEFDLTDALERRDESLHALLVIRVEDPMDNSEQPVGKQWRWYTSTSGIWQTVFVEPRAPSFIRSFRVVTDIEAGSARFVIQCANASQGDQVHLQITPPAAAAQTAVLDVCKGVAEGELTLKSVALWDPNSPNLYSLLLQLRSQQRNIDAVRGYFGLRKIDFELARESGVPAALRLNGVVRYLRGALYQSYFPDGVYTASSAEVLKNDIRSAKKFGFNFLRVHIKVDDPVLLYWADKLGILLMADFPNFGEGGDTALGRSRFETMIREAIERDFNHPSIFAWCLFNETWGFGGQATFADKLTEPIPQAKKSAIASGAKLSTAQKWVQQMWELAKQLDPTRLVEDMSVCHWEHLEYYLHCDTDINSWHFYINDYEKARAHIEKVVKSTFVGSSFNYVPGFNHKGQPLINSEYGGIGALEGDRDVSWSFKFLTNELRRYQQIAAYIYTELHDVEWEYNGFLNYDRTPKEFGYEPSLINESNALPVNSPPVQRVSPGAIVRLEVSSSHYSSVKHERLALHWEMGGTDSRGHLHKDLARGRVEIPFPHRHVAPAHSIELRMPDSTMLCVLNLTARTAEGLTVAQNFLSYYIGDHYPPEREKTPRSLILRGLPATWSRAEWSLGSASREQMQDADAAFGSGHGFFEWTLPLDGAQISEAQRIIVLCEASSHRTDNPQTDGNTFPSTLEISLNEVLVYHAVIHNHPHDSRGVLSYLRGGVGAYGYLARAVAEQASIKQIAAAGDGAIRLCCAVPTDAVAQGGLVLYGAECGRFPFCPTVIVEW